MKGTHQAHWWPRRNPAVLFVSELPGLASTAVENPSLVDIQFSLGFWELILSWFFSGLSNHALIHPRDPLLHWQLKDRCCQGSPGTFLYSIHSQLHAEDAKVRLVSPHLPRTQDLVRPATYPVSALTPATSNPASPKRAFPSYVLPVCISSCSQAQGTLPSSAGVIPDWLLRITALYVNSA